MSIFRKRSIFLEQQDGGAGGGGAPDWRASLPEDIRAAPSVAKFADPGALAKSYIELERTLGDSIRPPGPDAAPEAHQAFQDKLAARVKGKLIYLPEDPKAREAVEPTAFEALGRPKEAKGYSFEGLDLAGLNGEELAKEAFDLGLTQAQARKMAERAAGAAQRAAAGLAEIKAELATEFGAALPEALQLAAAAAEQTGAPPAVRDALKNGTADKATVAYFRNLAKTVGAQPREIAGQGSGGRGAAMTPSEAEARMNEIMKREEFFNPGKNPDEHRRLVAELARLEAFASPDLAAAAARNGT